MADRIESRILLVRGQKVMLDADLAELYGVTTKRLNEQVRRNRQRFPADFMFQLTNHEVAILRSQFATASTQGTDPNGVLMNRPQMAAGSRKYRDLRYGPWVFSEYGALMAANLLKSERAVAMSVHVVRAFVRLRNLVASHKDLAKRLDELESRYDRQFKVVFDAIREFMAPPAVPSKRRIGFITDD